GDTLRAEVKGKIQVDIPGSTFDRGFIEFKSKKLGAVGYNPINEPSEYARLTSRDFGMPVAQMLLSIYDQSEDNWYYCDNVPILDEDSLGLTRYNLDLNVLRADGCPIPSDYIYAANDSIIFEIDYKVNYNTNSLLLNYGKMDLEYKNVNAVYNGFTPELDIFTCNCTRQYVEIANYKTVITESLGRIDWCEGRSEPIELNIKYGTFSNYTPFEYKPAVELSYFSIPAMPGVRLDSVQIISLFSNGQRIIVDPQDPSTYVDIDIPEPTVDNVNFPGSAPIEGFYELDLFENLDITWDDNLELRLRYFYQNEGCIFNGNPNYFGRNDNSYAESIRSSRIKKDSIHKMGLLGKFLIMDLVPSICDVTSLSDTITWELELRYSSFYPFEESINEVDLYLEVASPNGNLIPIEVIDLSSNQSYSYENGLLNLGRAQESDTLTLLVKAVSLSCETENIAFNYGWICEDATEACLEKQLECTGVSPPGVIDMLVDTSANEYALCDTFEWRDIQIFNAGLGKLKDIELIATLPPGLEVVEGSSRLIYPLQNGQEYTIADPDNQVKNRYTWSINDTILPFIETGLPGVTGAPLNSFEVVFQVVSKCAFISGSRLIFTTRSNLVCDKESNTVSRISGPQSISDLDTSARVDIMADHSFNYCTDELIVSYTLLPDSLFGIGNKLLIQLPPGIFYQSNSCISNGMSCTVVEDEGTLSIELDAGLDTVNVDLSFAVDSSLACERVIIPAYATASVNAFCASENLECSIDYVTGEAIQQIDLDKPSFEFQNINLNLDFNQLSTGITMDIGNIGEADADSVIVSIYLDLDGTQTITVGDSLIEDIIIYERISSGENLVYIYNNNDLSTEDLCQLIISIDEDKNCICSGDAVANFDKIISNFNNTLICSGDSILIGANSEMGLAYLWSESENISCVDCPQTTFFYVNEGFLPKTFTYLLQVTDSTNCSILYEYNITVPPSLEIATPPSTVCS
ncbi:MAG: hypothetical protein HKN09_13885, partial [Saprospiraceae bacterium]|nr:hypothetical protein [Saprospiraceae bacterium]